MRPATVPLLSALVIAVGCTPLNPVDSALPAAPVLRVVSLNVAGGFDARYRTPEAAAAQRAFVGAAGPDVACLQEVVGDPAVHFPSPGWWTFAPEGVTDGQPAGNALWVRDGIDVGEWWILDVPYPGAWARKAIFAYVAGVLVACTHLEADHAVAGDADADRAAEMEAIAALPPDVLVGDMNAPAERLATFAAPLEVATRDGCIDQAWSQRGGAGSLLVTEGERSLVSDHSYAAMLDAPMVAP